MKLIQNELIQNENSEQNSEQNSSKTLEQKKFRTKFRTKIHNKNSQFLEHTKIQIKNTPFPDDFADNLLITDEITSCCYFPLLLSDTQTTR